MQQVIGVRELGDQISRIVRTVREEGAEYVITVEGKPVAVLRPISEKDIQQLGQKESAQRRLIEFLDDVQVRLPEVSEEEADHDVAEAIQFIRATK